MAGIFISHAGNDIAETLAVQEWLKTNGWDDVFLDTDRLRGIPPAQLWEEVLKAEVARSELVLFLLSEDWLQSDWCMKEFNIAWAHSKRMLGAIVSPMPMERVPEEIAKWQCVDLTRGNRDIEFRVTHPSGEWTRPVAFCEDGLTRMRAGLVAGGIGAKYFPWPPETDPERSPYRGLSPLEAEDAGIFFGRDAAIVEGLDRLRHLREASPSCLLVILGASGAGKSSFLRAGLLPRLARDGASFVPLPVVRPGRAAVNGPGGLVASLSAAFARHARTPGRRERVKTKAMVRAAVEEGGAQMGDLLRELAELNRPAADELGKPGQAPTFILPIDQAEELYRAEGLQESELFFARLEDLLADHAPPLIALATIRSDSFERLQHETRLEGLQQHALSLPPMRSGAYSDVITGPARRLEETTRPLRLEPALVNALLEDMEASGARDALPLLAFTLAHLYEEHGKDGDLSLAEYEEMGRIKGSIEQAVERALEAADAHPVLADAGLGPERRHEARLERLRRGFVPWLAAIDPDTGTPRRRVAVLSEIPEDSRPLIEHLVEQRLLTRDVSPDTKEATVEPAHEALLRQWDILDGWLQMEKGSLVLRDVVLREAQEWADGGQSARYLARAAERLADAQALLDKPGFAKSLESAVPYLAACRKAEQAARRRVRRTRASIYALMLGVIVALLGVIYKEPLGDLWFEYATVRPTMARSFAPHVLAPQAEAALEPGDAFRECAEACPEMVVVPAGAFRMGSPDGEGYTSEQPRHTVTIARPFAAGRFEVTWDEWEACVALRGCDGAPTGDQGYGRGDRPVINVSWDQASDYVAWLSHMTGTEYRLLSEAEWEYAARGVTSPDAPHTSYPWGEEASHEYANYGKDQCCAGASQGRDEWDFTAPAGRFPANSFGLHDMHGNVWEWVEDRWHDDYAGAPADGSAWRAGGDDSGRVVRGGSWIDLPGILRSAVRVRDTTEHRDSILGFRVARTLTL